MNEIRTSWMTDDMLWVKSEDVDGTPTLNRTWQEIYDAMCSGKLVVVFQEFTPTRAEISLVRKCAFVAGDEVYKVYTYEETNGVFVCSAPDDYPTLAE